MINVFEHKKINIINIFSYLTDGIKLAFCKQIRPYIIIPILANILLIGLAVIIFFTFVSSYISGILLGFYDNGFLLFLSYIITAILSISLLLLMIYYFSTLSIIIASPFYGFLAQKIEVMYTNQAPIDESFAAIFKDVPRILKRELDKQIYFIPRAIVCLIITLIPVVNFISPLCWVYLTSKMATIQFTDYGFDNNKISFADMKKALNANKLSSLSFGFIIICTMALPFINLVVPVIAVCAGTLYFLDLHGFNIQNNSNKQNLKKVEE